MKNLIKLKLIENTQHALGISWPTCLSDSLTETATAAAAAAAAQPKVSGNCGLWNQPEVYIFYWGVQLYRHCQSEKTKVPEGRGHLLTAFIVGDSHHVCILIPSDSPCNVFIFLIVGLADDQRRARWIVIKYSLIHSDSQLALMIAISHFGSSFRRQVCCFEVTQVHRAVSKY